MIMRMSCLAILLIAASVFMASPALAVTKDCFVMKSNEWEVCGEEKQGLVLTFENVCVETMQLKLCMEKEGGEKDCKWFLNVKKGEAITMKSCDNTGSYDLSACEDRADCKE